MAAAPIVEAFDERERRITRLDLCLEPAAIEKLAFEGGEEALAHGIVVCVADRAHRGAHARVTAQALTVSAHDRCDDWLNPSCEPWSE